MTERTFFLGFTAEERNRVWAHVRLDRHLGTDEFTDHHIGPRPVEVSISFTLASPGNVREDYPENLPERYYLSGGQVPPEDRVITAYAHDDGPFIEQVWKDWHLNAMNAACDHLEGIEPTEAQLAEFPEKYGRRDVTGWKIHHLVCPEGYRWGTKWLAKRLPDHVLAKLNILIGTSFEEVTS